MTTQEQKTLIVAVTGASGAYAAQLLLQKAPWPVSLIASEHGESVYERECGTFAGLKRLARTTYRDDDLSALPASGSVPSAGMVILPCTTNTLAKVAAGIADTLITRAAHCHLKERRPLVLCVRETPWTGIDFANAERISSSGGVVMPLSPPFYMFADQPPQDVSMHMLLDCFVDRVLSVLGHAAARTWETVR